jgi:hypothetical protein
MNENWYTKRKKESKDVNEPVWREQRPSDTVTEIRFKRKRYYYEQPNNYLTKQPNGISNGSRSN